ncbi:MAG: hypothetical protein KJO23_06885 [Bacteroidia bacterium]|nr:hypothetical protein [Bacteroidia bacterium]NNM22304.1 hypothetical protein [Flavobacteriaceae bacterium]
MNAPVFFKLLVALTCLFQIQFCISQVGIGTTTARTTLEVAGDTEISGNVQIGTFKPLNDNETSSFLIQETDSSIKSLDVSNPTGAALAYIQEYIIVNPNLDWIKDFDTGIDATDYVLIVTSASYDLELDLTEAAGAENNASLPYASTFIKYGTWHIIADYPQAANLDETAIGTWTIKTLIFSSDVSKQFGSVDIPMSNLPVGAATAPIID